MSDVRLFANNRGAKAMRALTHGIAAAMALLIPAAHAQAPRSPATPTMAETTKSASACVEQATVPAVP